MFGYVMLGFGSGGGFVPTTWDPAKIGSNITLSNGNLTETYGSTASAGALSLAAITVPAYFELTINTALGGSTYRVGVATSGTNLNQIGGADSVSWVYDAATGNKVNSGSSTAYGTAYGNGANIGIAYNPTTQKVWFRLNGTWQASGDPAADTNEAFSSVSGTLYALASQNDNGFNVTANFGATAFSYSVPSGFQAGVG